MSKNSRSPHALTNIQDKKMVLSLQQVVTYSIVCITIGASIYTFFKALPRIDALDETIHQLKVSNARVDQQITDLKEIIGLQKKIKEPGLTQ